ncbi:MAG: cupin domain-containing protein [Bacteroidales bacterium]|jgi:mannose-6-phosphate isomerase-like protein (cupin superfamily)|nr:cupin domain-containing protein [Bacteroidales bacterium]
MATILKSGQRKFQEAPNKIDNFRIFTDVSIQEKGIKSQNLNFDVRQLNPGQYSAPYHFHRYAEELFMIISGSATLRTPSGLEVVGNGDLIFFEMGKQERTSYTITQRKLVFFWISGPISDMMYVNTLIPINY